MRQDALPKGESVFWAVEAGVQLETRVARGQVNWAQGLEGSKRRASGTAGSLPGRCQRARVESQLRREGSVEMGLRVGGLKGATKNKFPASSLMDVDGQLWRGINPRYNNTTHAKSQNVDS